MEAVIQMKVALTEWSGLARDAMHIYVALIIFMLACLRWRAWQWKPWFLVFLAALIGEAIDIRESLRLDNRAYLAGNWHDLWNTMLLPTVLMLTARYTTILAPRSCDQSDKESCSGDEP